MATVEEQEKMLPNGENESPDGIEMRMLQMKPTLINIRTIHVMADPEIALQVEVQGEMIDRIEYNIQQAMMYAEVSREEMKEAYQLQSKFKRKRILMIMIFIALLGVIVISTVGCYFGF